MEPIGLRDGRRLAMHRLAEGTNGRTVVLCHPAPGSGAFDPDPEATWSRGVTLLGPDRAGYGSSDPRSAGAGGFAAAADDLAEALDQLGTGPVGLAGWSAGGLVALALAVRRPDLVDRLVLIATPAPEEEVAWMPAGAARGFGRAGVGRSGCLARSAEPRRAWWRPGRGWAGGPDVAALDSAGCPASAEGDASRGFPAGRGGTCRRPGRSPRPVGVRARSGRCQDPAALRRQGSDRRAATREVVSAAPAERALRAVARAPATWSSWPTWRRALAHLAPERSARPVGIAAVERGRGAVREG